MFYQCKHDLKIRYYCIVECIWKSVGVPKPLMVDIGARRGRARSTCQVCHIRFSVAIDVTTNEKLSMRTLSYSELIYTHTSIFIRDITV